MANEDQYRPQFRTKVDTIQLCRFIAAIVVVVFHATLYTNQRLEPGFKLYKLGGNGVPLFFVISGFVMVTSSEHLRFVRRGWGSFMIKRLVRVVPMYWVVMTLKLCTMLWDPALAVNHDMSHSFLLKSYLFMPLADASGLVTPFYNVGWTLNFEMLFYVVFTIALAIRANPLVVCSVVMVPLAVLSRYTTPQWPDVKMYCDVIVLNFLFGMIAAKLIMSEWKLSNCVAIPAVCVSLLYLFVPRVGPIGAVVGSDGTASFLCSFMIVYGAASLEERWRTRIPHSLLALGGASYSLYLIHPLVAPVGPFVLHRYDLQWPWCSVFLGVSISVVVGGLVYKYCERPLTQLVAGGVLRITALRTTRPVASP